MYPCAKFENLIGELQILGLNNPQKIKNKFFFEKINIKIVISFSELEELQILGPNLPQKI